MFSSMKIQRNLRFLSSDNFGFLGNSLLKALLISGLVLYLISVFLFSHPYRPPSNFFSPLTIKQTNSSIPNVTDSPTIINHLVFGLVGSVKAWKHRKAYIESWWRPNVTRGYLFLDKSPTPELLPWPESSPPFKVSENLTKLLKQSKFISPVAVRIAHAILEVFREDHDGIIRWYIMGDDDSTFFLENIVDVLSKYDHTKYIYIGGHSETIVSDFRISFDMGFGGAGFILSYPLAKALVKDLENCLKRYANSRFADKITMGCIADLGVPFTSNRGLHQIDLRGDISGYLSAHPQFPLLSLHHFDVIDPIFPNKTRAQSSYHLMKAANVDQSRLLQQTVCYHKQTNWSFSVSWGYSVHVYEKVIPKSILKIPIETFRPWVKNMRPPVLYLFNTRQPSDDPCEAPHAFYFESIERRPENHEIVTSYARIFPRGLPPCSSTGNHTADHVSRIQVYTSAMKRNEIYRSECCDIAQVSGTNTTEVRFRDCMIDEIIA